MTLLLKRYKRSGDSPNILTGLGDLEGSPRLFPEMLNVKHPRNLPHSGVIKRPVDQRISRRTSVPSTYKVICRG